MGKQSRFDRSMISPVFLAVQSLPFEENNELYELMEKKYV
jgi:hypothetical protein